MLDKKTTAVAIAIQLFDICTYIVGNCKIFLIKKNKKTNKQGVHIWFKIKIDNKLLVAREWLVRG